LVIAFAVTISAAPFHLIQGLQNHRQILEKFTIHFLDLGHGILASIRSTPMP
jgi:hypothetical protein